MNQYFKKMGIRINTLDAGHPSRLAMMSVPSFQFMISYRQTNALQRPQRLAVGWIPRSQTCQALRGDEASKTYHVGAPANLTALQAIEHLIIHLSVAASGTLADHQ